MKTQIIYLQGGATLQYESEIVLELSQIGQCSLTILGEHKRQGFMRSLKYRSYFETNLTIDEKSEIYLFKEVESQTVLFKKYSGNLKQHQEMILLIDGISTSYSDYMGELVVIDITLIKNKFTQRSLTCQHLIESYENDDSKQFYQFDYTNRYLYNTTLFCGYTQFDANDYVLEQSLQTEATQKAYESFGSLDQHVSHVSDLTLIVAIPVDDHVVNHIFHYTGEMLYNLLPHGNGTLIIDAATSYSGMFVFGAMQGLGKLVIGSQVFSGDFYLNRLQDINCGIVQFDEHFQMIQTYEGELISLEDDNNILIPNGEGILKTMLFTNEHNQNNFTQVIGKFNHGYSSVIGEFAFPNQDKYFGCYSNGTLKIQLENNFYRLMQITPFSVTNYIGEISNDKPNGVGCKLFQNQISFGIYKSEQVSLKLIDYKNLMFRNQSISFSITNDLNVKRLQAILSPKCQLHMTVEQEQVKYYFKQFNLYIQANGQVNIEQLTSANSRLLITQYGLIIELHSNQQLSSLHKNINMSIYQKWINELSLILQQMQEQQSQLMSLTSKYSFLMDWCRNQSFGVSD